jgi:hypothetical protein
MPYYRNVPQVGQRINASRPQIQSNFQEIETLIGQNHVTFSGDAAHQGKHNLTEFVLRADNPDPSANNINLYCKNYAPSGRSELYIKRNGVASFPITARQNPYVPSSTAVAATYSWVMLSDTIILVYGQNELTAATNTQNIVNIAPVASFNQRPYAVVTPTGTSAAFANYKNIYVRFANAGPYDQLYVYGEQGIFVTWFVIGAITV